MNFTAHQKGLRRHDIEMNTGPVAAMLESVISTQSDEELVSQAVKCVVSWASEGVLIAVPGNLIDLLVGCVFKYHTVNSG